MEYRAKEIADAIRNEMYKTHPYMNCTFLWFCIFLKNVQNSISPENIGILGNSGKRTKKLGYTPKKKNVQNSFSFSCLVGMGYRT